MPSISRKQELEWHRRVAGVPPLTDLHEVHDRIDAATIRFSGEAGLEALHALDDFIANDPATFSARALYTPIDELTIFRLLITPCTSVRTPHRVRQRQPMRMGMRFDPATVTINVQNLSSTFVRTNSHVSETPKGRMNYLSGTTPYAVDRPELTDTLGVAIPLALLPELSEAIRRKPHQVLPDTPINSGAAAFLARFLFERVIVPPSDRADEIDAQAAVLAIVRSSLEPVLREPVRRDKEAIRTVIDQQIEERYRNRDFTIDSLAETLGVSRRQLYRYVGADSIARKLARRRAEAARQLIEADPTQSLQAVAQRAGFNDTHRLRAHFVREYGVPPSILRNALLRGENMELPADGASAS